MSTNTTNGELTFEQVRKLELILWGVSGTFTTLACLLSFWLIYQHLRNWARPDQQKYIIRLLLMVPIYAIDSWLSLRWREYAIYFDIARDCYEAYVIYQFFTLLTAYIEGDKPGTLFTILADKPAVKFPFPFCCLPGFKPSPLFVVIIKQCILQYVVIKPVMSIIAAILEITNNFHEGNFLPWYGYVYVVGITFASVMVSMYFLVWFYFTTEEDLKPYSPVAKFICIKAILFFSFWQGVLFAFMTYFKFIPKQVGGWKEEHIARGLQDFIICVEMFLLSVTHPFVFSYEPYKSGYHISTAVSVFQEPVTNFALHVVNQNDIVTDLKITYSPKTLSEAKKQHKVVKQNYLDKKTKELEEFHFLVEKGEEEEVVMRGKVLLEVFDQVSGKEEVHAVVTDVTGVTEDMDVKDVTDVTESLIEQ